MAWNGAATAKNAEMNFLKYRVAPMKLLSFLTFVGVGHHLIASILDRSTFISLPPITCPRYTKGLFPSSNFLRLAINCSFLSVSNMYFRCEIYSFQVVLKISMPSKFIITKESINGSNTSFIKHKNVGSVLHKPKGITNLSTSPSLS
jgi:hypothetical protein